MEHRERFIYKYMLKHENRKQAFNILCPFPYSYHIDWCYLQYCKFCVICYNEFNVLLFKVNISPFGMVPFVIVNVMYHYIIHLGNMSMIINIKIHHITLQTKLCLLQ